MIPLNRSSSTAPVIKMVQPSVNDRIKRMFVSKKIRSNELNFAYSFRPTYYFSRVFGLMPFSIISESNGEVQSRVTAFDAVWFIISMCLYLAIACISYNERLRRAKVLSVSTIGYKIHLIFTLVFGAISIGFDMYNRFKLVDILNKFTRFDREVSTTVWFNWFLCILHKNIYLYFMICFPDC